MDLRDVVQANNGKPFQNTAALAVSAGPSDKKLGTKYPHLFRMRNVYHLAVGKFQLKWLEWSNIQRVGNWLRIIHLLSPEIR